MKHYHKMLHHWKHNGPPVYVSVAGYLGLIKEEKDNKPGDLNELLKMSRGGMIQ